MLKKTLSQEQPVGDDKQEKLNFGKWERPSDYMKWSRPEEFSDSYDATDYRLARDFLEYKLESITSREEELDFEVFARRLAEKEICPNLIPMTGPVGGGDGKVDADTYPVADVIAIGWLVGTPNRASAERWGFAISAKKRWRDKVKSDVKNALSTGRNYSALYFITNQFARGKDCQAVQDEVQRDFGVRLTILDRNWILEKVFNNGRQRLAIESLHLDDESIIQKRMVSSNDSERQARLDELESFITSPERYRGFDYQMAEDCLSAALLARTLEQSLDQLEVKFARSLRIAKRVGINSQILRIKYNRIWTLFFWYDQVDELWTEYLDLETCIVLSQDADHYELLTNIWTLLLPRVERGDYGDIANQFKEHTSILISNLDKLAYDDTRPANALRAREARCHISLMFAINQHSDISPVMNEFAMIAHDCELLLSFPVDRFVTRIETLGEYITDCDSYDSLLLECLELRDRRTGEAETGLGMSRRAYQLLRNDKFASAILWFGKAITRLAKYEYSDNLVHAMMGMSHVYSELGLNWAARTQLIAAASLKSKSLLESGKPSRLLYLIMKQMIWNELKLGRVPCVINSIATMRFVANLMHLDETDKNDLEEEICMIDSVFGILLIQSSIPDLKKVPYYPSLLSTMGFYASEVALLYAMGQEEVLRNSEGFGQNTSSEEMLDFFSKYFDQPAYRHLCEQPNFMLGDNLTIKTKILGCDISFTTSRQESGLIVAETLCSALESLLSISFRHKVIPHIARIEVQLVQDLEVGQPATFTVDGKRLIIHHPPYPLSASPESFAQSRDLIIQFIGYILGHYFMIDDSKSVLSELFIEEGGLERALSFTKLDILQSNIIQNSDYYSINGLSELRLQEFETLRDVEWYKSIKLNEFIPKRSEGEVPEELIDNERLSHRAIQVLSLIDVPLWDAAEWRGTGYAYTDDPRGLPALILAFRKSEYGVKIFQQWIDEIGEVDKKERLFISIIKGICKDSPDDYRVMITAKMIFPDSEKGSPGYFYLTTRTLEMKSTSRVHIEGFLQSFKSHGKYTLVPGQLDDAGGIAKPRFSSIINVVGAKIPAIIKTELKTINAWEVGRHDIEGAAIFADDEVFIPSDVSNAPVIEVLKWKKQNEDKRKAQS